MSGLFCEVEAGDADGGADAGQFVEELVGAWWHWEHLAGNVSELAVLQAVHSEEVVVGLGVGHGDGEEVGLAARTENRELFSGGGVGLHF